MMQLSLFEESQTKQLQDSTNENIVVHIFVEEPSAKNVLEVILPQILPGNVYFQIYPHQGKQDLEKALNSTVPSISKTHGARILVMRDQDNEDCKDVKKKIIELLRGSSAPTLVRIVCHELESWFLGDLIAVSKAYPRFKPDSVSSRANFRDVDEIINANEQLLSIIPEYSGRTRLPKIEVSESIAPFMNLTSNNSKSFNNFLSGVNKLINTF